MCGVLSAGADECCEPIRKGLRVAVADGSQDPELARGRAGSPSCQRCSALVTPGTLTEEALIISVSDDFLAALARDGEGAAARYNIAALDISTGEFLLSEGRGARSSRRAFRLRPAELLLPDDETADEAAKRRAKPRARRCLPPRAYFTEQKGERRALKEAFEAAAIEGFGDFSDSDLAAIGALLHYVNLTQMGERPALQAPETRGPGALPLHRRRHAREPRTGAAEKRGRADPSSPPSTAPSRRRAGASS